jgi:hypothetical protein
MLVDLRLPKRAATESYPPGALGREFILMQPDTLDETTFDAIIQTLLLLLRARTEA